MLSSPDATITRNTAFRAFCGSDMESSQLRALRARATRVLVGSNPGPTALDASLAATRVASATSLVPPIGALPASAASDRKGNSLCDRE
jgi:hypothetical protein